MKENTLYCLDHAHFPSCDLKAQLSIMSTGNYNMSVNKTAASANAMYYVFIITPYGNRAHTNANTNRDTYAHA